MDAGIGSDNVHRVVDDQRGRFLAAVGADRECPCQFELRRVTGVDLIERAEPGVRVVMRRHHPLVRVAAQAIEIRRARIGSSGALGECRRAEGYEAAQNKYATADMIAQDVACYRNQSGLTFIPSVRRRLDFGNSIHSRFLKIGCTLLRTRRWLRRSSAACVSNAKWVIFRKPPRRRRRQPGPDCRCLR
jgi:hypothetical protein